MIADPSSGVVVSAERGQGTYIEKRRIVSSQYDHDSTYTQLECELPMSSAEDYEILKKIAPNVSGLRKSGSTVLDILNLVSGRNIVCLSSGLEPHDIAAGTLILEEAGFSATDFRGNDVTYQSRELLAAAPSQHERILKMMI